MSETNAVGSDKITRYGWTLQDRQGTLEYLNKNSLRVDEDYQRKEVLQKILTIASAWSWMACATIVVAKRCGEYWVVDGQHRVLAAKRRSDITDLPCIVFNSSGQSEEALGFYRVNSVRKPLDSISKWRALCVAMDVNALDLKREFERLGITVVSNAVGGKQTSSIAWCMKRAAEDYNSFVEVITLASDICDDGPIKEILLDGLWYINKYANGGGLENERLVARIILVGADRLILGAKRAAAIYVKGGAKQWAIGMMEEINKNLRIKFTLREEY